jgi:hypothetical protein
MHAIKGIGPAYASAYQVVVDTLLVGDAARVPKLYVAAERFHNNLCLNRAMPKPNTHTVCATLQCGSHNELPADT